jgi:hypothetical protein
LSRSAETSPTAPWQRMLRHPERIPTLWGCWLPTCPASRPLLQCHRTCHPYVQNHFLTGLWGTSKNFTLHLWDRLLPQALISLNLLRQSPLNLKLSAHAQLNGFFDYNRSPIGRSSTRVQAYGMPSNRTSWSTHACSNGWYTGPALNCYTAQWGGTWGGAVRHPTYAVCVYAAHWLFLSTLRLIYPFFCVTPPVCVIWANLFPISHFSFQMILPSFLINFAVSGISPFFVCATSSLSPLSSYRCQSHHWLLPSLFLSVKFTCHFFPPAVDGITLSFLSPLSVCYRLD